MLKESNPECLSCNSLCKSIFIELNSEELNLLNSSKTNVTYKKGDTIFNEGAYPRGLYCIFSGKIKVIQTGADGKEQILHLSKEADIIGYRALLSDDKYSCSAIAMEDSKLCFIPKEVFLSLVEKNSKLALHIIHLFSQELKDAERKITSIAQRPVKERISQTLILLKERYGFENDGCTINVHITREEIANIAGTTRETAIRALFELKDNNIIELSGKKIKIHKYEDLVKSANIFDY